MREVFGGEFNFSKRAVTVTINGKQIAASLQGWPHGSDTIPSNDMNGHICLYFDGSLSHVGSLPDAEHQELVYRASGQKLIFKRAKAGNISRLIINLLSPPWHQVLY